MEGDDKAGPEAQLKAEAGAAPGRHLHPQNRIVMLRTFFGKIKGK